MPVIEQIKDRIEKPTRLIVVAHGHASNNELVQRLQDRKNTVHVIGDCLAPRDAEAAIFEGLKIGTSI